MSSHAGKTLFFKDRKKPVLAMEREARFLLWKFSSVGPKSLTKDSERHPKTAQTSPRTPRRMPKVTKRTPESHKRLRKAPKDSPDEPKDTPEDAKSHQKNARGLPKRTQNVIKLEKGRKAKTDLFRKSQKH